MSELRHAVEDYLAIRRGLGFKLRGHDRLLVDFVEFITDALAPSITAELALRWATQPQGVQPVWWSQRLSVVRGFARYLHAIDVSVEVPPADLLPVRRRRGAPRLYSEAEIASLVAATSTLRPPLRAVTHATFFGLIAATGLRIGEAIDLDRDDVDLGRGMLVVKRAKFDKWRQLPLHQSTVDALQLYAERRDALCPRPKAPSFFVSTRGTRLLQTCVHAVFSGLVGQVGLEPHPGAGRPRVHGLRHSFAVATLCDWYRADVDVAARLPVLSAYLGHVGPSSTYWYLQAAPELLGLAAERLERFTEQAP